MGTLKVLYLRSTFDPGGTESLLLNLFNYPQDYIQFHYALLKNGSLICELKSEQNKYYKYFRNNRFDLFVIIKLFIIINKNKIRIIHTHQLIELIYAVVLKIIKPKLKLYHTIHGFHDKQSKWDQKFEQFLIRFTKGIFTVSRASRNNLKHRGYKVDNMKVLYNAVSQLSIINYELINCIKKRLCSQPDDFIVGMIGNFTPAKDQMTIITAFNLIKEKLPKLKIIFIGKESYLSEGCKSQLYIEDLNTRVFFLGSINNASECLCLFDLFIMSSLTETFGIVVVEAMLQKVPVLASDIEVMRELSYNGKYFQLFEKQNPYDLANKIKDHNDNWRKNKVRIERAYKHSQQNYSYSNYLKQLAEYYSS